jgi:hypothetical protein
VRWNSAIAIPGSAAPITATMPSDTPMGEHGQREGQQREFPDYGQDQNRVAGTPARHRMTIPWKAETVAPPRHFR